MDQEINSIINEQFNLKVNAKRPLSGYSTENTLLSTSDSNQYVLKEYTDKTMELDWLEEESRIINILSEKYPGQFPGPIRTKHGNFTGISQNKTGVKKIRIFEYLEGGFFTNQNPTQRLIQSFGTFLAKMDLELLKVNSLPIEARISDWDIQHLYRFENRSKHIEDTQIKKLTDYFNLQFKETVLPVLPKLRKSLIHGDANDGNVLVDKDNVTGIIDFGDICYSPLINELAIALTYVMFNKEDPLLAGSWLITAYNKTLPLEKEEIQLLYYLIGARLTMSLWNSSFYNKKSNNEHVSMSEEGATQLIIKWASINPIHITNTFLKAAGYPTDEKHTIEQSINKRRKHISNSLSISYNDPIQMVKAAFQYMFDNTGKTYLDMCNNIPHVGHCHPLVVRAGQKQMAQLNTNTRYLYDNLHSYSEKLLKTFPEKLNKVFYVNSGSAANDLAIRLARTHTKGHDLMIMEHGYHGNTEIGIEISSYKFDGKGGDGKADHIVIAPIPDLLRGKYRNEKEPGDKYAQDAFQWISQHQTQIAAFITEPIIGCGGQIPLPPKYLSKMYEKIREQGGVCISDEVQTGFGRLGGAFWGFEQHNVIPDIVVIGKPMGNGHPMGAVITTDAIAHSFETGMEFFSSFGGNPVSCEIGMAVLDVIENENLQRNAMVIGNQLKRDLSTLQKKYSIIGDIRGSGLFLGIELVTNINTMEPGTDHAKKVKEELKKAGILIGTDGPCDNVLKIKPPLCFNEQNANYFIKKLTHILNDIQ